jgi:hypothetical protein
MRWMPGPGIQNLEAKNPNGIWMVSAEGLGSGRCPDCESLSTSRHSRYLRRPQDLPVQGVTVAPNVKVNRWRCRTALVHEYLLRLSSFRRSDYLTRIETGMPRLVMRFSTLQPIFASIR